MAGGLKVDYCHVAEGQDFKGGVQKVVQARSQSLSKKKLKLKSLKSFIEVAVLFSQCSVILLQLQTATAVSKNFPLAAYNLLFTLPGNLTKLHNFKDLDSYKYSCFPSSFSYLWSLFPGSVSHQSQNNPFHKFHYALCSAPHLLSHS